MSEWDKLWENMPLPITDQWGRTDTGPFIAFVMKVKAEGDRLQEKQRETQFLLNCESAILRDCRQQLGDYMKKIEAKNEVVVHGGRFEDIEDEKLRNILLGPHTKKPEGET